MKTQQPQPPNNTGGEAPATNVSKMRKLQLKYNGKNVRWTDVVPKGERAKWRKAPQWAKQQAFECYRRGAEFVCFVKDDDTGERWILADKPIFKEAWQP